MQQDNKPYTFTLTVTSGQNDPNPVVTSVQIQLAPADLIISPSVGPTRQVAYVDSFSQQVSVVDPSPSASGEIAYAWSCVDSAGVACTGLTYPNAPVMTVPALVLSAGSYVLSVVASKDSRKTSTVNFPVTILPTQPPQVVVKCPSGKLNVDSPLSISSSVQPRNPGQSKVTYAWATFATGLGPVTATDLNPTTANFVVNNAAVAYWTPGADYVMTLTVTETTGTVANSIAASCPVSIRALPFGGSLIVSPTQGLAFNTSFMISAPQWQADSGALTYAFYRKSGSSLLPLSSAQSDSSFSTQLPTATNVDGTHTIVVKVVDMSGATTIVESAPVTIIVPAVPLDTAQLSNILSTGLTAALQTGNADAALALISGIASSAAVSTSTDGSTTPAPVTQEAVALTDSLVSNIAKFADSVTPAQMVGTLTAVAANPGLLSPTAVSGITSILTSMFSNVLASSAKGDNGASTFQTGLGSSEKQGAAGMLASLLAAARAQAGKSNASSTRRRLLQTLSTEDSVLSVYSTAQRLLAVSGAGLTNPGSLWLSDVSTSTSTFFGVVRFSTTNGATQTITGTATDYITVTSDVEEEAAMDLRFITSKPNPITWNPETNVLLTDSSAITVEIADTTGALVGSDPMTTLAPLEAYTYYVVQKFSQSDCPTATCSPVCKLYDPESKEWSDADIATAVIDENAEVTCSSSVPGTLALVKGPTRVVVPPAGASGGSSSSSGLSPRQKGLIAMGVILFVLLVGGLLGALLYMQRRAKRSVVGPSTTSRQAQLSNLTIENEMVGTASMHPGTSSPQAHDWDQDPEAATTETRHVVVHMAPADE